jgi:drug/metabolite transporter (DMT)-like permease
MEIKSKSYIYLVASLLIGSFTPALLVFTKDANAFELFFLASLVSIPFGLMLVVKNKKTEDFANIFRSKSKIFYVALAALLTYVPYEFGIAYAEHFISASLTTVLFRLNPLLMLLFLPLLLRERLSKRQFLALSIAFVGILIGITGGNISSLTGGANLPIILFVLLLALGYALGTVVIKWQMVDNDLYLAASAFVLTVFFAVLFVGSGAHFAPLSTMDYSIILFLAVTNIFSFYMYIHALKVLKTTITTNTYLLSPFLTFIWASLILGEPIEAYYIAIAILVGVGVLIQRKDILGGSYLSRRAGRKAYKFTMYDVTGAFIDAQKGRIKEIVKSGGRVLAAKLDKASLRHIESMINESKFTGIYTGYEEFLGREAAFIKEVVGVGEEEVLVIKAGSNSENEEFFEELNNRVST